MKFTIAPPPPPPFWQMTETLTATDAKYPQRKDSHFKRFPIALQAGVNYTIDLKAGFDAYLILEDPGGNIVRINDDGGAGLNSRIDYQPAMSGQYHIVATTYGQGRTGAFQLTVRKDN